MQNRIFLKNFLETFSSEKYQFLSRKDFLWDQVFIKCREKINFYTSNYIEFRLECLRGNGIECSDLSMGIKLGNEIVAIIPLFYFKNEEEYELSFLEGCICPPLFIDQISKKIEKEISKILIENFKSLFFQLKLRTPIISDQLYPCVSLSIWHKSVMSQAKKCAIIRESFIDLKQDYSTIKSSYRKSYKALISKGYKLLHPHKLEKNNLNVWKEFKALHYKAAGRKTRSDMSWEILLEQIKENKANFYFCRDVNGVMIGGSLVMKSENEAFYAIAAYDRDLFHFPIGHLLQDFIIKDLLNTKIQWYRLGRLYRVTDFDNPTEKEIQIGQFKSGFSSHLITSYRFTDFN